MIRTPEERFARLPGYAYEPHFLEWEGLRLHFVDEGDGPPVLLFHGEPTWSFLYRGVIDRLVAAGYRALAADMPGFGKSDKPTDPDFYTYDRITTAMGQLVDHLDLDDATAVVHDWGGPLGLRLAVARPAVFRRLVIMNTGLYRGPRVSPAFQAWHSFVAANPDLPVGLILRNSAVAPWSPEVLAAYEAPFPTPEHKVGAWRLPLIVPMADDDPGAAEMLEVRAELGSWEHPALVLFSDQDPVFSLRAGERLCSEIPGAGPLEVVTGAGHFLQEDNPAAVSERIIAFLDRTA